MKGDPSSPIGGDLPLLFCTCPDCSRVIDLVKAQVPLCRGSTLLSPAETHFDLHIGRCASCGRYMQGWPESSGPNHRV